MIRTAIFPNKYVQGRNAIAQIGDYVQPLGETALLLVDKNVRSFVESPIKASLDDQGISLAVTEFGGESSWDEIHRIAYMAKSSGISVIIGAGGGKTLDTAKSAANSAGCRVVILPTTASTDAPTSALSVVYTAQGEFQEYNFLPTNPDVVLMDTEIIANAPVRSLISGMGDALATWFEADTSIRTGSKNMAGGLSTSTGLMLAQLCYSQLLEYGPQALLANADHVVTPALEKIVEANTLLSGIGFESGGLAAAHAIHNGLTALPATHSHLHGEKVAFGTLTQLILEDRDTDLIEGVIGFMLTVGLPVTFEGIGLLDVTRDDLRRAADAAVKEGETIHNEPFKVTAEDVMDAMIMANALGHSFPAGIGAVTTIPEQRAA